MLLAGRALQTLSASDVKPTLDGLKAASDGMAAGLKTADGAAKFGKVISGLTKFGAITGVLGGVTGILSALFGESADEQILDELKRQGQQLNEIQTQLVGIAQQINGLSSQISALPAEVRFAAGWAGGSWGERRLAEAGAELF